VAPRERRELADAVYLLGGEVGSSRLCRRAEEARNCEAVLAADCRGQPAPHRWLAIGHVTKVGKVRMGLDLILRQTFDLILRQTYYLTWRPIRAPGLTRMRPAGRVRGTTPDKGSQLDLRALTNEAVAGPTTSSPTACGARHTAKSPPGWCEAEAVALSARVAAAVEGSPPGRLPVLIGRLLGRDFSGVRIHTGERAAGYAAALGADAFAAGCDVVFGATRCSTRLLAHELVHVAQQGAAPRRGRAELAVRCRAPLGVQRQIDFTKLYEFFCPPPLMPKRYSSTGTIGTAYGKWLGFQYMQEVQPYPYGLVDFYVWRRDDWAGGMISDLHKFDQGVALALMTHERTRMGLRRTDILNAELDEVYEIKPVGDAAEGPPQLAGYIQQLKLNAPTTPTTPPGSWLYPAVRPRLWTGGTVFDPTRYPMIVPGAPGQVCMIHAWMDPNTQGLILYSIVCCELPEQEEDQPALVEVVLKDVVAELKDFKPKFEEAVARFVGRALPGSAFAILASPAFFKTFVLRPRATKQDAMLEKAYGLKPSPAFAALILESFVLAHLLPVPSAISDVAYVTSGFMDWEVVRNIWIYEIVGGAAGGLGLALAGGGAALTATVVETAPLGAGAPLAATETLVPVTAAPLAPSVLINGFDATVTVVVGQGVAPYMVLPPAAGAGGAGLGGGAATGLGVILVALVGALPATANADPASVQASDAKLVAASPFMAAPTELLAPKRGKIELGAEVTLGDEKFFIVGLAAAPKGP
jgi:Domain of unknown function (DUF4157)